MGLNFDTNLLIKFPDLIKWNGLIKNEEIWHKYATWLKIIKQLIYKKLAINFKEIICSREIYIQF